MKIRVSKGDIIWGYISIFFQLASGIIVLPFILRKFTPEEMGLNYLMLTISSLAALFDFGFGPQFGRNITYVFSGATELKKEGVSEMNGCMVNSHLLAVMISIAKMVYRRLSFVVFLLLITLGTLYVYNATNGFSSVKNTLLIWIIFSISHFFNVYFSYYTSLLVGKGLIMENKKAIIASKCVYILLSLLLVSFGYGLMGLCIANLISPFVCRYISYRYFFTQEIVNSIKNEIIERKEIKDTFNIIWYNAKKMGIALVGGYVSLKLGLFIAGLFLPLDQIGSYGLMTQIGGVVVTISTTYFMVQQPTFASYRVSGMVNGCRVLFSRSMMFYFLTFIAGAIFMFFFVPYFLDVLSSNTKMPSRFIVGAYLIFSFLEQNHSLCATYISTGNRILWVESSLINGAVIVLLSVCFLKYTSLGVLGLVLAQGLTMIFYSNWKWPYEALKELKITPFKMLSLGYNSLIGSIIRIWKK